MEITCLKINLFCNSSYRNRNMNCALSSTFSLTIIRVTFSLVRSSKSLPDKK
jgi:hypothetical protein